MMSLPAMRVLQQVENQIRIARSREMTVERFQVKTVINAAGTQTRAGGTLMDQR
ncbi:MAG: hypothetical protein R2853_19750 [Thermomicrobiales bacterium]